MNLSELPSIRYPQMISKLMALLASNDAAGFFEAAMRTRIDKTTREMMTIVDHDATLFLKGQLSICYELADAASEALKSAEAKANAEVDGDSLSDLSMET